MEWGKSNIYLRLMLAKRWTEMDWTNEKRKEKRTSPNDPTPIPNRTGACITSRNFAKIRCSPYAIGCFRAVSENFESVAVESKIEILIGCWRENRRNSAGRG